MDEFGVLTERYGLKPQGKSAPMSQAKRSTATATASTNRSFGVDSGLNGNSASFSLKSSWNSSSGNGSFLDDNDLFSNPKISFGLADDYGFGFGGFENTTKKQSNTSKNSSNGSSLDLNSMLFNSGDDIFGGMPGSQNASNDDIFGSFASSTVQKGSSSDLLGDFSGVAAKLKSSSRNGPRDSGKNEAGFDDLIPGFGGSSPSVNRTNVKTTKSTLQSTEDPFVVLESTVSSSVYNSSESSTDPLEEFSMFNQSAGTKPRGSSNASSSLRPPPKPAQVLKADKVKSSGASLIDDLEDFAIGGVRNKASRYKEAEDVTKKTQQYREDDLESYFAVNSRSSSAPKSRATTSDPMFDVNIHNRQQKPAAGASSTAKKTSSAATAFGIDDISSIFGAAAMFGEFEEVQGESEERRKARLGRHQRTQDRVARAVADMNQRDRQTQHEQEERRRIAEAMDFEIKRWAAGKEGNMRALLSSLQQVLWPECGWEPVSLTDLITSGSVKKVYRKATLCVHPDKVQQKGATLEQKYIAEKVFDVLKEQGDQSPKLSCLVLGI
ncbi:hypothetical protein CCACVL1_30468 [Corchorus capsularis]|uniref:J domain-containing protein n=1 Tax=Corchorus capsularis TaxID=210143 RepID=A0A1R3FX79_COCAP|nr:hypothetical protein CCACVL1_30468 [Corchorus capsularis]